MRRFLVVPNRMAPNAPSLRHLWIGLPFFVILYRSSVDSIPLFDFWWHLKMGQIIVDKWTIPRFDLFSYTAAGKLYVLQNWLAEVFLYGVFKAGGPPLVLFVNGIVLACALIPILMLCRKASQGLVALVFPATLVAFCIPGSVRPQVFSYLLFALCYWLLSSCWDGKHNRIWLIPVLFALWVNLHGAFVLGLGLIAILLACETARTFYDDGQPKLTPRQLYILGAVLLSCMVATLVNPEGYRIYQHVLTVANSPSVRQYVTEWQPPVISQFQGIFMFYGPFFLLTFTLFGTRKRPTLTELVLYGSFSILGLMAIRNAAWFLVIAAPLIARHMPQAEDFKRFFKSKQNPDLSPVKTGLARRESFILNYVILTAALVSLVIQSPWLHARNLLEPGTPVGAMDFIDKHELKGNIYHSQSYGDFLIWRLWPKQRCFFDGRVHLYDESLVKFYLQVMSDSHWEEMLEKYQVKYLLLPKGKSGSEEMRMVDKARKSKYWKSLYEDSASELFERSR